MPAFKRQSAAGLSRWRYRKVVTLPDGRKVRITGTPEVDSKQAAIDAERAHIARVLVEGPAPIGRPLPAKCDRSCSPMCHQRSAPAQTSRSARPAPRTRHPWFAPSSA